MTNWDSIRIPLQLQALSQSCFRGQFSKILTCEYLLCDNIAAGRQGSQMELEGCYYVCHCISAFGCMYSSVLFIKRASLYDHCTLDHVCTLKYVLLNWCVSCCLCKIGAFTSRCDFQHLWCAPWSIEIFLFSFTIFPRCT